MIARNNQSKDAKTNKTIEDSEIIKKLLKHLDLWESDPNHLREPMIRRLRPLSSFGIDLFIDN